MSILNFSKFDSVYCNDEHTYINKENSDLQYTPVTTFVSKHKNKFDSDKVSNIVAKKRKISQDEVLLEWETQTLRGTWVHLFISVFLTENKRRINDEILPIGSYCNQFEKFYSLFSKRFDAIAVEQVVFDSELKLAGTVDLIAHDKKDGKFVIFDWKTNNSIDTTGYNGSVMLPPFSEYADCNFIHYSLQLEIYRKILQKSFQQVTFKPGFIVHLTPTAFSVIPVKEINLDAVDGR